ncbi:response regulator [Herbaspirillum sp. YR522]|uniref:response regulator n=1 Tax=Herbaspirillum sp. YR522 TaxID=1144342 RepID=UPI00026F99A1|nr:response regulator [Herbaspirillum sp. YR522]EJN07941.1 response regulator with CheY-like receiver domain and winged-helix DNA-binding domain [Herbaspirillum sp. YR522]
MKPPIILMIESNGEAIELARFALWRSNFHCILQWYDDADAASERLLHRRRAGPDRQLPRLVLLDPAMMENNGLEFIRAMRSGRATRNIPIVVFADADYPPAMNDLLDAGANEYLQKPEAADDYMQTLLDCVERWGRGRAARQA